MPESMVLPVWTVPLLDEAVTAPHKGHTTPYGDTHGQLAAAAGGRGFIPFGGYMAGNGYAIQTTTV